MKLGISALGYNLEEAISICKKNKALNHIEIGIDNLDECETILKYKHVFEKNNLSIGIHLPMELNSCDNVKFIRDSWIKFVEEIDNNLSELKIDYYNMHLGYCISNRYTNKKEKYLDNTIDFLKSLSLKIDKYIYIENVYSHSGDIINIGNSVYEFDYIFNSIGNINNIGFCYDSGHDLINKGNYIKNLSNYIKLIHLSDNDGIDDIHLGLNKGILAYNDIKEIINLESKYIILEVNYEDINSSLDIIKNIIND